MGFFKLTKWKVIITLILTAIFEYLVYFVGTGAVLCKTCGDPNLVACPPCGLPEAGYTLAAITLIPALFIIYLIVCLIYYIYKKLK